MNYILLKDDSKYVIVVKEDGTTENVDIQTGISNDNYVEVTSGLNGGEKVQIIQTITTSSGKSNSSSANGMFGGQNGKSEITGKGESVFTRGGMSGEQILHIFSIFSFDSSIPRLLSLHN